MTITAVLDSCVLYPMPLCDTLLRVAEAGLYQPSFSQEILDGATRNLVKKTHMTETGAQRFQSLVIATFPEAMKDVSEKLTNRMTNHPGDRHVLAAAVTKPSCQFIVTLNLKHFKEADLQPWKVRAVHPDDFLCGLCDTYGARSLLEVVQQQSASLKNPPIPVVELLKKLSQGGCIKFSQRLLGQD